jgi:hypothetical protein
MPANPQNLTWRQPVDNVDGTPFTQAQFGGYELEVNGAGAVAIPAAWDEDRQYTFPIASLGLAPGTYTLRLRTVNSDDYASDWSNPATLVLGRVPNRPLDLSVA